MFRAAPDTGESAGPRARHACGSRAVRSDARDAVDEAAEFGIDLELLSGGAARQHLAATSVLGGTYTPHCATIHPAKLARRLADVVEARGVAIYEQRRASAIGPGAVVTPNGTLHAGVVVRATEGYTPRLPGSPYHFGSRTMPSYDRVPRVFAALRRAMVELFPVLRDVPSSCAGSARTRCGR